MLVCHCSRITDREIRETIRAGASSVEEVAAACGAAACCGGCEPMVERLIRLERGCPVARASEPAPRSAA